jgi:hypothetical protein
MADAPAQEAETHHSCVERLSDLTGRRTPFMCGVTILGRMQAVKLFDDAMARNLETECCLPLCEIGGVNDHKIIPEPVARERVQNNLEDIYFSGDVQSGSDVDSTIDCRSNLNRAMS